MSNGFTAVSWPATTPSANHLYAAYTAPPFQAAAQARITQDLAIITDVMQQWAGAQFHALILAGGFGRGEGAVLIQDHLPVPINDYDLVLVTHTPIDQTELPAIRRDLAKRLGIWWVDISVMTRAQLARLDYTMYHYDMKYAAQVIAGAPEVLGVIPTMDPTRMPWVEAETQFYTRLWCFLGPMTTEMWTRPLTPPEAFLLRNQLSKAVLACSDARLIAQGAYHPSYATRLRRLETLYPEDTALLPLARQATHFKLQPIPPKNPQDLKAEWWLVRQIFLDTMFTFVSHMYGRSFRHWHEYATWYQYHPRRWAYRSAYWLWKRSRYHHHRQAINLAQLYLLLAYTPEGIHPDWLAKASRQLACLHHPAPTEWESARQLAVRLRMEL